MKSGIYGLVNLDGAPINVSDRDLVFPRHGLTTHAAPGVLLGAVDADSSAIDVAQSAGAIDLFLGNLDERAEDAGRLGIAPDTGAASLAACAFAKWAADAAAKLAGEWSFAQWDGQARTLTLTMSEYARDDFYYSVKGGRVAFAPELVQLARLPWIGGAFDGDALLRSMTAAPLRTAIDNRTIVKGVNRLRPGQSVVINKSGLTNATAAAAPPPLLRAAEFEDAMAEVERLLRQIFRARLAGQADVAFMLSGGLDSSLLSWLGAEEREAGQRIHLLSSAAAPASGLPDETGWADQVASHLGLPLMRVAPHPAADIYAPTPRTFAAFEAPSVSPRHYLYEAFEDAAQACGARIIVDGLFGEATISSHAFSLASPRRRARTGARRMLDRLSSAFRAERAADVHFHVKPAPAALTRMNHHPSDDEDARHVSHPLLPGDPLGLEGYSKLSHHVTASSLPAVRYLLPLRDRRLVRLVASFPASFAVHDGAPRAMARALLRGHVPDKIALRQSKMAFSPTYHVMLRDQAERARARIVAQRQAGAGEWVDLNWLDEALHKAGAGRGLTHDQAYKVQGTAIAAEFFRWWHDRAAVEEPARVPDVGA